MGMLDDLNASFGKEDAIRFTGGESGWCKALMKERGGHTLELYLYGATITRWRDPSSKDLLFTSSKAVFAGGKAIRGGIPLIFPQFGGGKLPSHGFARTSEWSVQGAETLPSGAAALTLRLAHSEGSEKIWPHHFSLELRIELSSKLMTRLTVTNTGSAPFPFENAFHTYFPVESIHETTIHGLSGLDFLDNTKKRERGHESSAEVRIAGEVDRVYVDAPDRTEIRDNRSGRAFIVEKRGMRDAVLWNPWIEKSAKLGDFDPQEYLEMVCLETGNVANAVELAPGQAYVCEQTLSYKG